MSEFSRTYHHKIWQGNHIMSLIPDKAVVVDSPTGPKEVWRTGLSVKFTRGTYQCKDPRIATLIERHREFKIGQIIKLPDPKEFAASGTQDRLNIPKQAAQPVAQGQGQPDPQVAQLTEMVGRLMAEIKSLKAERPMQAVPREDHPTLQESEYQPMPAVPEQQQEYQEPVGEMPSGIDGDIPIPKRQPLEQDQGPPKDLGTPEPLNANAIAPDGRFVNVQKIGEEGYMPPGGDGVIKPSVGTMRQNLESGMDDIERIVERGDPLPPGSLDGAEIFDPNHPGAKPAPIRDGGHTNDPMPLPEGALPESTAPQTPIVESKEVIHEAKRIAVVNKELQPKPRVKEVDGKRALYCKICGEGPYTSGRSVGKHRQEKHPEIYASKKV